MAVVLGVSGVARADHATEMKAREDFAAGRYDEALELFAKLYAETLNAVYLRNIGRCHQKLRHPDKAIDAFQDYLAKGKKSRPTSTPRSTATSKRWKRCATNRPSSNSPPPAARAGGHATRRYNRSAAGGEPPPGYPRRVRRHAAAGP